MNERTKFVHRLEDGERMIDLCREFGISRKTGYKIKRRYEEEGIEALIDRSRRPLSSPNKTPRAVIDLIVELRLLKPTWGPKKLLWLLKKNYPGVRLPAESTIALILKREGLVKTRRRRRRATPTLGPLTEGIEPNEVWAMDFKGQFKLGNSRYCYPLTLTDHFSRYILLCDGLESTKHEPVKTALKRVFKDFGIPKVVRSDNGAPFASTGRCGLSRLGVWMMRQGIKLERIEPGHPEQNGRHERMHRTLKQETTRPAQANGLAQQEVFDSFVDEFNTNRPHEALKMKTPASVYKPSPRQFLPVPTPLTYPTHDIEATVKHNGHAYFNPLKKRLFVGEAFVGERIGFREIDAHSWVVNFIDFELGIIDIASEQILTKATPRGCHLCP
jgi:transposase InsO family protein